MVLLTFKSRKQGQTYLHTFSYYISFDRYISITSIKMTFLIASIFSLIIYKEIAISR